MRARCIFGHAATGGGIRNQGFQFSRCRNCGRDLVRSRRAWRRVPTGFRVVWRLVKPQPTPIDPAQLRLDLPVAGLALAIPISRPRRRACGWLDLATIALRVVAMAAAERLRAWRTWIPARRAAQPLLGFARVD